MLSNFNGRHFESVPLLIHKLNLEILETDFWAKFCKFLFWKFESVDNLNLKSDMNKQLK